MLSRGTLPLCWPLCWLLILTSINGQTEPEHLKNQIEALRAEIAHHDELYFQKAAPEITDYEYDLLKLELRRLEAEAGLTTEPSGIGDDRSSGSDQIAHRQPMLSLDKAYSTQDVARFFERVAEVAGERTAVFSLEPKFDGVAVSVVFERGEMISAASRGNGVQGEDITDQVGAIRRLGYDWESDPITPRIERIELRGEIFLSDHRFTTLNVDRIASGDAPFRHPRSVAAGSVKLDDLGEVSDRGLSLVFHGWGEVRPSAAAPLSVMDFQRWLEANGLPSVLNARFVTPQNAAELNAAVDSFRATVSGYPTDGVVIKVDLVELQQRLGFSPAAPRWAIARKFAPPRAETTLRAIVWQVGRTGVLTPVAEFDPVVLGGATIRRASLSNPNEIARRDLRIGDVVEIEKAGEIIPQIVGVDREQRDKQAVGYVMPTTCPSCASVLESDPGASELVCPTFDCDAQVIQRLRHFVSRDALDIRGVGPVMAERLVEAGLVRCPSDLYALNPEELVDLRGVGEKTAARLIANIEASRSAPIEHWMIGLGLPGVGRRGAESLAAEIQSLDELLDESARESGFKDLGPVAAAEVAAYLDRPAVRRMVRGLAAIQE